MTFCMAAKEATQPIRFTGLHTLPQPYLLEPEIEADETKNSSEESTTNSDSITTSEETEVEDLDDSAPVI